MPDAKSYIDTAGNITVLTLVELTNRFTCVRVRVCVYGFNSALRMDKAE